MRKGGEEMLLKELRKRKGFSQQYMANKLDIGLTTYCQYENGGRKIPENVAVIIAKILDVNIYDIFLPFKFTLRENNKH